VSAAGRAGFWQWSLQCYAAEGAAPLLLRLQDNFGFNVNLLLWCAWCAGHYRELPEETMRTAMNLSARWSGEVSAPLRAARRALKSPPAEADAGAVSDLRASVKAAELAAERIEQEMLARLAADVLPRLDDAAGAEIRLRRNFAAYARAMRPHPGEEEIDALLDELAIIVMTGGFDADSCEAAHE
jgi:uncharacterized protein (TIGR02444 family)